MDFDGMTPRRWCEKRHNELWEKLVTAFVEHKVCVNPSPEKTCVPEARFTNRKSKLYGRANEVWCEYYFAGIRKGGKRFEEVIAHELCHVWLKRLHGRRMGHGQEFKFAMSVIGFQGTRYTNFK